MHHVLFICQISPILEMNTKTEAQFTNMDGGSFYQQAEDLPNTREEAKHALRRQTALRQGEEDPFLGLVEVR